VHVLPAPSHKHQHGDSNYGANLAREHGTSSGAGLELFPVACSLFPVH
jgi:hypothetical protein